MVVAAPASAADAGGLREVTVGVKGAGAYAVFKHEAGVHRVQRIPQTESQGRLHTSTATVAVLPEVEDVDVIAEREKEETEKKAKKSKKSEKKDKSDEKSEDGSANDEDEKSEEKP